MTTLTCPACGAALDKMTVPVASPPTLVFDETGPGLEMRHTAPKGALLCSRCEWAEDVDTLLKELK